MGSGALSIAYSSAPLYIVRGSGAYLFDEHQRGYLDLVNNVCHVGHCHPRVVAAAQKQLAVLNTNTRYLHPNIVQFASRLSATLPSPLQVCFFVNSGSEANDLALRLARCYTKGKDVISLGQGYHGALTSTVAISPYKYEGRGGFRPPKWSHKATMPDSYRGPIRSSEPRAGERYAEHVQRVIEDIRRQDRKLACFIAETVLSCGGQIVPPEGYLQAVYGHVRRAGGVCIADEVQTGLGRVGSHFWAFETQGVVPDIVTMGKPIGNGFPLAAVVTTPEIAAAFAQNGMEYFNTFGGNPVACAVGLAVLDVIRDEQLQQNALAMGNYMKARLEKLQEKHPIIGDVRGYGLFLGVELVRSRETLEPAEQEINAIVAAMKEKGVLLGTDGPFHNVIKIKPPLVIAKRDVDLFVDALDACIANLSLSSPSPSLSQARL